MPSTLLQTIYTPTSSGWDKSGISLELNITLNIFKMLNTNRILNQIQIFSDLEFDHNIEHCRDVLRGPAERHHPVAMGTSQGRHCRHCGLTHQSFCLLSYLTMKTMSYSRQTSHISYVYIQYYTHFNTHTRL